MGGNFWSKKNTWNNPSNILFKIILMVGWSHKLSQPVHPTVNSGILDSHSYRGLRRPLLTGLPPSPQSSVKENIRLWVVLELRSFQNSMSFWWDCSSPGLNPTQEHLRAAHWSLSFSGKTIPSHNHHPTVFQYLMNFNIKKCPKLWSYEGNYFIGID